ncbi:MAG: hypothetical protein WBB62_03185 [Rhodococcus sp. (in: high G+C Gram-positive bacteria)]|jgi:hypothetical protein|uniref:DUF7144 family membrane protein n=1 Tax=Nocardiaceae TaxID=85025 RepID=UPI001E57EC23|nr:MULTISPECIES: hypothetical protein [Rhodococcus]MCC8929452.1 hypothetical protein [Rhodococcus sp. I2R]MCZ4276685.1 hypothetical protein [Rhodococcus yunnanensis]
MTTTSHPVRQGFAAGITMFAAILLLVAGMLSILRGIAGVSKDEIFVMPGDYIYKLDLTTWGWIYIVLGVLAVAVAIGMMMTATWARVVALSLAALSLIANFLSLPYYPWWSIILIVLNVIVIWAISSWHPNRA